MAEQPSIVAQLKPAENLRFMEARNAVALWDSIRNQIEPQSQFPGIEEHRDLIAATLAAGILSKPGN